MNNTDLENLYTKINGHILLVAAYTQDQDIKKIIRSCRLKPHSIFTGDFQPGTRFEDHWVDEFGNSLKFKDKSARVVLNSVNISDNTKISTDLFFGNSVKTVAENSKSVFIAKGRYLEKDFCLVAFYGQDEYLRVFTHNEKWNRVSPLLLGVATLHELFKHIGNLWTEVDKKRLDFVLPFDVEKCALISLPMKRHITPDFDNIINNIYKGDNN
jgi:hypothetical protein